ncbi:MAG TPA: tRNA epoxyqueuosine(34) reductase QueG [Terriglobales bacterium]|nr:tRNA epoxyqueuosine(34) reductase QueG [Terriglobales bacterium]
MPAISSISALIKDSARELGFDLAGIAPVQQFRELEYFPQWIAEQRHGEMRYLESRTEAGDLKRASIQKAAPWAKSVIVCALNYNTDQPYSTEFPDKSRGWISRYAWGQRDYHDIILPKLRALEERIREATGEPQARMWSYVDTGPVVERVLAQHAGIGWVGKNTCIINQQLGSWLFLGVILTSIELEADILAPDRCGTCTRCLDACPTNAFVDAYKLDASKCISYLTIEKRGSIPKELREGMQNHVFGCDICQDVCPWNNRTNREAALTNTAEFQPRPDLVNPPLEKLATISEDEFRTMFKNSPVKRTKRSGIRRNAVIAIGNSGDRRFLPLLTELEADADESVAEHARWAVKKIRS